MEAYQCDEEFWTSDDEEEDQLDDDDADIDGEECVTFDKSTNGTLLGSQEYNSQKNADIEDTFECSAAYEVECVNGRVLQPEPLVTPPRGKGKQIRKKWVVIDNTDVSTENFKTIVPEPAMTFPFECDDFQKKAIVHLERNDHTFVAAHTSSGKTVVAEYAIALSRKKGMQAIYTSPIKALSNQKFREFKSKFDSVGIITGDVTLEKDAQCLIVTTEILRTMLYRGDAMLNNLGVVIFDEVHYVSDSDRGVVWEETIIMLPPTVQMVLLSATVPNYLQFADWIGRTKQREVFAIFTQKRPTPLMHYLWIKDKSFLLMDGNCRFNSSAYNQMYKFIKSMENDKKRQLQAAAAKGTGKAKAKAQQILQQKKFAQPKQQTEAAKLKTETYRLQTLLRKLKGDTLLPVVVFCFSRRKCESYSTSMPKLDILDHEERSKVHVFVKEALSSLSEEDREVSQVQVVSQLVEQGIGVHHGGLLPIIKEMVEILFSRGLVKILFATETFAMGVNMPARSVIFSTVSKHDGQRFRMLHSSEYTQMAGRAGRRGLDSFGNVYIFCASDEPPDNQELTKMMLEKATPLTSQFRLTYNMMLQLSKRSGMKIEEMMEKSYREASRAQEKPIIRRNLIRRKKELMELPEVECLFGEPTIESYVDDDQSARLIASELHRSLYACKQSYDIFCPGRVAVVHLTSLASSSCYGVILHQEKTQTNAEHGPPTFRMLIASPTVSVPQPEVPKKSSHLDDGSNPNTDKFQILRTIELSDSSMTPKVFLLCEHVSLESIATIYAHVIKRTAAPSGNDEVPLSSLAQQLDTLLEYGENLRPYVLAKEFKTVEMAFFDALLKQKDILHRLCSNKCHKCQKKEEHFRLISTKRHCEAEIDYNQFALQNESLDLYDELVKRLEVLKVRGFIDFDGCITLKGRVACEITATDEITLTEVLFNNILQDKLPEEAVALLSFFAFSEKSQDEPTGPTAAMAEAQAQIEEIHGSIERVMRAFKIGVDNRAWWSLCNPRLSLVVFQWARGVPFSQIMESTTLQEGTVVRAIQRLAELTGKVKDAALIMGDVTLEKLMGEAESRIRRDIIFAQSLYLC